MWWCQVMVRFREGWKDFGWYQRSPPNGCSYCAKWWIKVVTMCFRFFSCTWLYTSAVAKKIVDEDHFYSTQIIILATDGVSRYIQVLNWMKGNKFEVIWVTWLTIQGFTANGGHLRTEELLSPGHTLIKEAQRGDSLVIMKIVEVTTSEKVAQHFNPELFKPKLQPWSFQPILFNHELFNHELFNKISLCLKWPNPLGSGYFNPNAVFLFQPLTFQSQTLVQKCMVEEFMV